MFAGSCNTPEVLMKAYVNNVHGVVYFNSPVSRMLKDRCCRTRTAEIRGIFTPGFIRERQWDGIPAVTGVELLKWMEIKLIPNTLGSSWHVAVFIWCQKVVVQV